MSNIQDFSEAQSKLIFSRINHTERNIGLINESFEKMLKKENKICNKIDEIANKFKFISSNENFDESFGKMFENMCNTMVHLADIKTIKIARFEERLLPDLMQSETICKKTRDDAKTLIALRDFELNKRSQINFNKKSKKNILTENEAMLSNIQVSKVLKEILSISEKFEVQKFDDFKQFFLNFILIEMKYFASGIEILTSAFVDISNIDERSEQFIFEMKGFNKLFKKHVEQDSLHRFKTPFMRALSRFSHSSSNIDMIGKDENKHKKINASKSLMSLNNLESKNANSRKHFTPDLSTVEKASTTDDTDIDDSSDMEPTDTENVKNIPQN